MTKGRVLNKLSRTATKVAIKHSSIFMKKKWLILVGILATCLAMGLGRAFAQPTDQQFTYAVTAVNIAWTLAMGALVWFMQLGFAYLGAGLLRSKNQVNYWTKSYVDFSIGVVIFALIGFGLMFGGSGAAFPTGIDAAGNVLYTRVPGLAEGNSIIGWSGFGLGGEAYNYLTLTYFFFQAVFAATTVTIVAGMVAERMKFEAYLMYTILINIFIYPIYGHWIWGGGWLATLPFGVGARDFAGSSVVHALGGFVGLAGAFLLGPRIGKFGKDGKPKTFAYTNITYVVAGTMILFLGWFGFNPGSTLGTIDFRTAAVAVNTYLAGGAGAVIAVAITYFDKKNFKGPDIVAVCTGALAGLVAVTAPCAYIAPWAGIVIGLVAAPLAIYGNYFVERKLKIDDPVGAFGIHGLGGLFGMLSVGLFADGTYGGVKGIFLFGADAGGQLVAQLIAIVTVASFALGMGLLIFGLIKYTIGLRAPAKDEIVGLDLSEHGYSAYPELVMKPEEEAAEIPDTTIDHRHKEKQTSTQGKTEKS
jgi:ammonium transporter, Amt family